MYGKFDRLISCLSVCLFVCLCVTFVCLFPYFVGLVLRFFIFVFCHLSVRLIDLLHDGLVNRVVCLFVVLFVD